MREPVRVVIVVALITSLLSACGSAAPSAAPTNSAASTPAAPSPAPASPTVEATVPIEWKTYTSSRYAYSVDYPTDWVATPAKQDWPSTGFSYPDDPAVDKWGLPPTSPIWVLMFVSSVPLNVGEVAAERIAKLDGDNAQVCQLSNRRDVAIDGVTARQEDGKCFGSDYISEVAVVNKGRFYMIWLLSANPFSETSLATFDRFLASFRFGKQ